MFLTKIWSVLVTLWAVAMTAGFLLSTPPAEYELGEAYEKQLDGAQGLMDSHMRMESRRRLDFFSEVGKDYKIVKLIKQLTGKTKDTGASVAKTLQIYLRQKLVGKAGDAAFKRRFDQVVFTDRNGKVWARLGKDAGEIGDSMKSFPGVKRALSQRVCSDNTIDLGGALHFVWSCPVRYVKEGAKVEFVGAVMGEKKIDDAFAMSLLKLIGVSADEGGAKGKKARKGKKGKKGKTAELKKPGGRKLKVNVAFFRSRKLVAKSTQSKLWSQVAVVYKKYQAMVDKRTIGRSPAVEVKGGGKRYLMVVGRLPGEAAGAGNVWAILWQYPAKLGPTAFLDSKIPRSELFKYMPWTLFIIGAVLALFFTVFFMYIEADRPIGKLLRQSRDLASGAMDRIEDQQFRGRIGSIARSMNEAVERVADAQPSRPPLHDKDLDSILGGPDVSDEDYSLGGETAKEAAAPVLPAAAPSAPTVPAAEEGPPPPPPDLPPAPPQGGVPFGGTGRPPVTSPGHGPQVDGPPPPPTPSEADLEMARFEAIFEDFIATKKECGESTENLTLEAFAAKLRKNKEAVIAKTGCAEVQFKVYVKEGKAALKASPVK